MKNAAPAALVSTRSTAQAAICASGRKPRASIAPSIGALTAWVKGTPNRAGPMIATVSSVAAMLAPYPSRAPWRCATRARAVPPASATQKPPVGAARDARNEAVAT